VGESTATQPAAAACRICSNGPHTVYHAGGPCPYSVAEQLEYRVRALINGEQEAENEATIVQLRSALERICDALSLITRGSETARKAVGIARDALHRPETSAPVPPRMAIRGETERGEG
jgi:hypothetical protein